MRDDAVGHGGKGSRNRQGVASEASDRCANPRRDDQHRGVGPPELRCGAEKSNQGHLKPVH